MSVTELRHICISKRWGSKLPLMKAAKVNIHKHILSILCFFLHCSICPPYVEVNKLWNTSLVSIQWAKPHDATKMPQLLCVKLEDPKQFTSQALRRSRAVIDFRSKGPGFESLGYRSVGVSRLTLALALEVGSPTRLRSSYIPQKFTARPMQMKYMLGLHTHKTKTKQTPVNYNDSNGHIGRVSKFTERFH